MSRGLGLISMEERLKLLKGTISIESAPRCGTTIHARVPLSSRSYSMRASRESTEITDPSWWLRANG